MTDTANIGVTKIDVNVEQKEVIANEAFDVFDAALSEIAIAMSDANYTLSTSTTPKEWQYGTIKLSGALTADRNVVVPTNKKTYQVVNGTSGGHSIVFKTSAGTGITVTNGATAIVRCDGTNVVAITGGSGAGTVTSVGIASTDLSVSGGPVTTSGNITVNINNDAVTYAKMQNVSATNKLLGRATAGSGDVEEIDCTAAGRALLDDPDAAAQRTTLGLGTSAVIDIDTDGTLAANSDSKIATQKAVKTAINALLGANDAEVYKGLIDCSADPNYPAADAGHVYRVSVAGKIGGASGINVEVNDRLQCIVDSTASGNQATVGANWWITQANIDGAVVGPASATDGHLVVFDGATGKLIKDGGVAPTGTNTGDQTITLTGDVTGSGTGSFAATIANDAVTNAKLANMANSTIKGRTTAGTGDPEDLSASQAAAILQGDGLTSAQVGFRNIPQNSQSAAYTTVAADSGKHILHPSADTTARTFTIDSNANVAYPIGTAITFINENGAGTVTIAITSDTMRLAGAGTTGSRTLAANGIATAIKITSTSWIISGTNLT